MSLPDPPLWFWWPVTALTSATLVATDLYLIVTRHGRSRGARGLIVLLSVVLLPLPLLPLSFGGNPRCSDTGYNGSSWGSGLLLVVLLLVWISGLTALYRVAGTGSLSWLIPILIAVGMAPFVLIEATVSFVGLTGSCDGRGLTPLLSHLSVAVLIAAGAGYLLSRKMRTTAL